jgi:hypothetical protein
MLKNFLHTAILVLLAQIATAQQFIGLSPNGYTSIQQVPYNPAWVNTAKNGVEINIVGFSVLAGNNAYSITKHSLFHPEADTNMELGKDYFKVKTSKNRRLWTNADVLGPAVSFKLNKDYQVGIYTRFRTIVNAGNLTDYQFAVFTDTANPDYFRHAMDFKNVGATAHAFGEIGISLGKMLMDDEYYKLRVGANIKYLLGWAAFNVNANGLSYQRAGDSLIYAKGDLTGMYTYNVNPSSTDLAQRAGKGGLGLDIGVQYEFHLEGDPNRKTPYKWSVAASITDIGSVPYVADKGSATYTVNTDSMLLSNLNLLDADQKELGFYAQRMINDTALFSQQKYDKFRIGLPTALRLNADWYLGENLYVSLNTLLSLKGHGKKIYRAGYVSYLNFTPRFDLGNFKFGLPITLIRYKTFTMGATFNLGPLYFGSTTLVSSMMVGDNISNVDFYAGLTYKITHRTRTHLREYDNGYGGDGSFLSRFIPGFLKHGRLRKSGAYGNGSLNGGWWR